MADGPSGIDGDRRDLIGFVLLGGVAPLVAATGLALLTWRGVPLLVMAGVGLLSVGADLFPALLVPLIGSSIDAGRGDVGMLALGVVSLIAGLANLRPAVEAS